MSSSSEEQSSTLGDAVSPPEVQRARPKISASGSGGERNAPETPPSSTTFDGDVPSKNRPRSARASSGSSLAAQATPVERPKDGAPGAASKDLARKELQNKMTAEESSQSTGTESSSTSASKSEGPRRRTSASMAVMRVVNEPEKIAVAHEETQLKAIAGSDEAPLKPAGYKEPRSSAGSPSTMKQPKKEMTSGDTMRSPTTPTTNLLPATKIEKPVSLITQEVLRRAASKARERPPTALTLDDMAECYGGMSWRPLNGDTRRNRGFSGAPDNPPGHLKPLHQDDAQDGLRVVDDYEVHNRYTHVDYLLYPLAAFLLACLVVFVIIMLVPTEGTPRSLTVPRSKVCSSADCLKNAEYLSQLLSWDDVNPCHDFYAFVCRQWIGTYATAPDGPSISTDDDLAVHLEARLHALLQNSSPRTQDDILPAAVLHQKCMDTEGIEDRGWDPVLELMPAVLLEGFPFTPPVRSGINIWKTAASLLRKTGTSALFGVGVSSDPNTPSDNIMSLKPPDSLTSNGDIDVSKVKTMYTNAASTAMKSLKKEFVPSAYIVSIAEFASELENIVHLALEYHWPMRIDFAPSSHVSVFFTQLFSELQRPTVIGTRLPVMVQCYPIVSRILKLVQDAEAHTVMNYLGVRLMVQLSPFLPTSGLTDIYSAVLYGRHPGTLPRWRLCVRVTEKAIFPLAYASLLADLNSNVTTSRLADQAREVVAEFRNSIETYPYFTPESRLNMRTVLKWIHLRVIGPDWASDKDSINAYAQALPFINNETALETYVRFHQYTFDTSLGREPSQRWSRSAFSTECWFEPYPDTIYVPMAAFNISHAVQGRPDDFQLPRLAPKMFGCVFAALLSKTAVKPPYGQRPWYSGRTKAMLQEVETCFESQKPPAAAMGFRRTRDVLAACFAYDLFLKKIRTSQHGLTLKLTRGRSLTEEQLFFVYLMLQRCEKGGLRENGAPTGGYDWNVALRNAKYFSNAFECEPATAMNPAKKCLDI